MLQDLIRKYGFETVPTTLKPNYIKIPVNRCLINTEDIEIFNTFYKEVFGNQELNKLVRTKSGGISYARGNFRLPAYDIDIKYTLRGQLQSIEIVLALDEMCRIQFSGRPSDVVGGSTAFKEFRKIFAKFGIDITDYAVEKEEGIRIKKEEIEQPMIKLERQTFRDMIFENAHHLDFHSSYPTGLINTHPELKEPIEWMYENRKVAVKGFKDYYKGVMNSSIGYFQSEYCAYRYSGLSRDAINDNNRRIRDLAARLTESGRMVISYNTDGIWYAGDLYHDENEGKGLGTWQNDHINCKFRAKSDGAYEFIEDGKYYPVVRGATRLDRIKPRTEWEWGDIYQDDAKPVMFTFIEGEGIVWQDN